jgi:di/tricarboxylate transporter
MTAAPSFHMWATFAIIALAFVTYFLDKWRMELTSLSVIASILLLFQIFPMRGSGADAIDTGPAAILAGFANPALIAVLALLVMGQGLIRTGILDRGAQWFLDSTQGKMPSTVAILLVFIFVGVTSGFLNNTPVVVIFIPIMQAMASRYGISPSRVMMALSFVAILGGMTTLIGSSTNLLVNTALVGVGLEPFSFFEFTIPGAILASIGLLYAAFVVPRMLPDRAGMAASVLPDGSGKQFILQIEVAEGSELEGEKTVAGHFKALPDMTVRMIQRGEQAILPPFEDFTAQVGDVIVVAATRTALREALIDHGDLFHPDLRDGKSLDEDDDAPWTGGDQQLAEVMIAPASRLIGQTLRQVGFRYKTGCIVLGIQRRARMIRARITDIRLEAGDVILLQGRREDLVALRQNRDVVLIESSRQELPRLDHAVQACLIFFVTILLAATGTLPIVVSSFIGAIAMIASGVINVRQAFRAIDPTIATAVAAALAMSTAMTATGGASFIAHGIAEVLSDAGPAAMISALFLIAALLTNVISNNAVAVLFTPIAIDLARQVGVDPVPFAIAMVFAANCSFASPMGYQTNLLVMGPGHYTFSDFARAGVPMIFIIWIAFSALAFVYWGF